MGYTVEASVDSTLVYIIQRSMPMANTLIEENRQVASFDADLWGDGGFTTNG
jgi:hypothetical protein